MCGILFCNSTKPVDEIFDMINYRGPDNTTCLHKDFWFCHHRLRVIQFSKDLEVGNQPITKEGIVLISNGEIYNFKELAKELDISDISVDCEIILHLYLKLGPLGMKKLDGDFAFILYDTKKNVIVTGRDHVGLKPLYIGTDNNKNVIGMCSEIKVLEQIEGIENIVRHPIGEIRVIDNTDNNLKFTHKKKLIDYDSINNQVFKGGLQDALKGIRYYLTKSVEKRILHNNVNKLTTDNVPYALLCSGGVDSSLILAICVKLLGLNNIHVFTMKFDSDNSFDTVYAEMLTKSLNIKNHTIVSFTKKEGLDSIPEVIHRLETHDPNTIRASIPMYLLAKYIRKNTEFKVILSGEGADELFMGYNYFGIMNPTEIQARIEATRLIKNLHSFDILRAERCFSSHGLELRVPFLDKDFINYVLRLPGDMRLPKNGTEKWIMREAFRDLGIPEHIMNRQKERFSDGVGYSWVPTIINYAAEIDNNEKSLNTNERMDREKKYYRKIYNGFFKTDLILNRKMPVWAQQSDDKKDDVMAY